MNDGWAFDTLTDEIQEIVPSSQTNPCFYSPDNQHYFFKKDKIIAFVDDDDEEFLVKYSKGSD